MSISLAVKIPWWNNDLFALTDGSYSEIEAVRKTDVVLVWEFQLLKLKQMVEAYGTK